MQFVPLLKTNKQTNKQTKAPKKKHFRLAFFTHYLKVFQTACWQPWQDFMKIVCSYLFWRLCTCVRSWRSEEHAERNIFLFCINVSWRSVTSLSGCCSLLSHCMCLCCDVTVHVLHFCCDDACCVTCCVVTACWCTSCGCVRFCYGSVTVHVEDRETAGLILDKVKVRPSDTILDLKQTVSFPNYFIFLK